MSRSRVMAFLKQPVPGNRSRLTTWERNARALGADAPAFCMEALAWAPLELQYPALLILRQFGYDAWGHGHGSKLYYTIQGPGDRQVEMIRPLWTSPSPELTAHRIQPALVGLPETARPRRRTSLSRATRSHS